MCVVLTVLVTSLLVMHTQLCECILVGGASLQFLIPCIVCMLYTLNFAVDTFLSVFYKLVYTCQIKKITKLHIMHVSSVAQMHTALLQVSEI